MSIAKDGPISPTDVEWIGQPPEFAALNARQRRFVLGLIAGKNQSQAYRDAGYASLTPDVNASRLLRNAKVCFAFRQGTSVAEREGVAQALERQEFWSEVMRNPDLPLRERLRASELLGRAGGDFVQQPEAPPAIRVEFALDADSFLQSPSYLLPDPLQGVRGLPSVTGDVERA